MVNFEHAGNGPGRASGSPGRFGWHYLAIASAILAIHALLLHLMGRIPWCKCGFAIWTSHAWENDTSQDLADPYSFTHVIHGVAIYAVLRHVVRKLSINQRLIVA